MKPIYAAPFFGQFGAEVAVWAPWLRAQKEDWYVGRDMVVFCRRGHAELYRDFASQIIDVDEPEISAVSGVNAWVHGIGKLSRNCYHKFVCSDLRKRVALKDILCPTMPHPQHEKRMIVFADAVEPDPSVVVVHARNCSWQVHKNWPLGKWNELIAWYPNKYYAIGRKDQAMLPDGCVDLRGAPLSTVIRKMAGSCVVVGPESGPMALAEQAAARTVRWGICAGFTESWDPEVVEVARAMKSVGCRVAI